MAPNSNPLRFPGSVAEVFGIIRTPQSRKVAIPEGYLWVADNGMFTNRITIDDLWDWLEWMRPYRHRCLFATCPDVVADAVATLERFRFFSWRIRSLGYPVALVAQDGIESLRWPPSWAYDALFIGGSTEWKLSTAADWCIRQAQAKSKWTHVGRVNSQKRIRHFALIGVNSVDGTSLTYAPDRDYKRFTKQLMQPTLFTLEET